jgi:hypothetical protein
MANGQDFESKWNSLEGRDKDVFAQVTLLGKSWVASLESDNYHVAVARVMESVNLAKGVKDLSTRIELAKIVLVKLYCFAPHFSCELWEILGKGVRPVIVDEGRFFGDLARDLHLQNLETTFKFLQSEKLKTLLVSNSVFKLMVNNQFKGNFELGDAACDKIETSQALPTEITDALGPETEIKKIILVRRKKILNLILK